MGRIRVLDKAVSNMIAAGEVVERPASVVKELLENAMDAGAKHIVVEIKAGGISYIRVADDGYGMSREDAETCLVRHATSKIFTAEDLEGIETLGFRGEALASIAAVSRLEIYTRAQGEDLGTHLSADCGEEVELSDAGCPVGTTVIVRDLFCSTPARMKFLKKDFTEAGYIADILNRLALSHPDISFKFINNGKEALFTSGDGDLSACVYAVYGKEMKEAMRPVSFCEDEVAVSGLVASGLIARPNRNMQNFFINGRYVKSAMLAHAVEEAYKNEIMVGKFPACVLSLSVNPKMVDINVHPTKLEVKFADEKQMYHCVYWAVKNALTQETRIPEVQTPPKTSVFPAVVEKPKVAEPIRVEAKPAPKIPEETKPEMKPMKKPSFSMREPTAGVWPIPELIPPELPKTEEKIAEPITNEEAEIILFEEKKETVQPERESEETKDEAPVYQICGQVFDTYIIVEKDGEMLLVDQHAAHERLRYEELLSQYRNRSIVSQTMLIPAVVNLSAQEMATYREYRETLDALGFETEEFGKQSVAIRMTPEELAERDLGELLLEILTMIANSRKNISEDLVSRMLYSIACKGAIKANHRLHEEEMKALLDAVFSLSGINTCPHGRPITISFTKTFIEKQFKRIV